MVLSVLATTPGVGGTCPPVDESASRIRFLSPVLYDGRPFGRRFSGPSVHGDRDGVPIGLGATLEEKGYRTQAVGAFPDERVGPWRMPGSMPFINCLMMDMILSMPPIERWHGPRIGREDRDHCGSFFRSPALPMAPRAGVGKLPRRFSPVGVPPGFLETNGSRLHRRNHGPPGRPFERGAGFPSFATVCGDPLRIPIPRWLRSGEGEGGSLNNERGWGLRESEIRTVFHARGTGDRWPPGSVVVLGKFPMWAPPLLAALGVPVPTGTGRPLNWTRPLSRAIQRALGSCGLPGRKP